MAEQAPVSREETRSIEERGNEEPIEETETPKENQTETETPETPQDDKPEEKSKELQSALAQKDHYREKFEKAQKELKEFQKATPKDVEIPTSSNPMEVVRLAKALEGYSEEEVAFISRNASDKSIDSLIKATKDDWVKTAIQGQRDKVEKEKGTPSPTSPAHIGGKTKGDIGKMSDEEYSQFLQKNASVKQVGNRGI